MDSSSSSSDALWVDGAEGEMWRSWQICRRVASVLVNHSKHCCSKRQWGGDSVKVVEVGPHEKCRRGRSVERGESRRGQGKWGPPMVVCLVAKSEGNKICQIKYMTSHHAL
ncbi:hypothetical protein GOBAR_AA39635 [Gossypium barbadense]|uniref:Uncharacterized protein n=1 Tax=Gossypium barbadense TaxID=3634 RepID=A0A2P5VQF6_GOSBA|nr:hypothetical protein GOBAR_AA39635 [Gossypium barbadense]